jgi:hypothetical protein
MTPKEKAEELVEKFAGGLGEKLEMYNSEILIGAKQCALICVDEILYNFFDGSVKIKDGKKVFQGVWSTSHHAMEYYTEVKQEINKL